MDRNDVCIKFVENLNKDKNKICLGIASKKVKDILKDKFTFINAKYPFKLEKTDYKDNAFDVIHCCHILEHIKEDNKAISEIYRILKPNGFAIVQFPMSGDVKTKKLENKKHYRHYGYDVIKRFFKSGFKRIDMICMDKFKIFLIYK